MKATTLNHSRKLVILCLAVIALAVSLASAQPASAASGVNYCFKFSNGAAYNNAPVFLQVYTTSGWTNLVRSTTNINGCGSFTMGSYTNYYARVLAQQNVTGYGGVVIWSWIGTTPFNATPGTGTVGLGTGIVRCVAVTTLC